MVDGDEVGAGWEGSFDLEFGQCREDGGKDVAPAQHLFANGHEVGDSVFAIADELGRLSMQVLWCRWSETYFL